MARDVGELYGVEVDRGDHDLRGGSGRRVGRLGDLVVVEGGVDLLEQGDDLFAARRIAAVVDAPAAVFLFEAHQLVEQLVAARGEALALDRPGRAVLRRTARGPEAGKGDRHRQPQGDASWRGAVVR